MMRFDDYWPEDDDEAEAHGPRQPVPDGTHNGRISSVQLVTQPWAVGDTNPSGDCLEVTVDVGAAYYTLRETVPLHWRGKLGAICDAARVPAPQRGVEWDESQLEGCTVNVETAAAMSKAGKEYTRIAKWRTSAAGPIERPVKRAAAKPAARTQAAKVMESFDDDVPFKERAEFMGGPWDGRVATAEDGEPLPLEIVVPWRDGRHRYVLHREWYGGLDVEAVDYEYAGPFVVE